MIKDMRAILKGKWFIIIAWAAIIAILLTTAPNMEGLVRKKGQITVPEGYSSTKAQKIVKDVQSKENSGKDVLTALVFHSNKKLTEQDFQEAEKAVMQLEKHKKQLGITTITEPFKEKDLKDELISKDGKTVLVSLKVTAHGRDEKEMSKDLSDAIKYTKLEHYYTGTLLYWKLDD